ncbi:MAG: DUF2889 domain-containing protein [Dethiobacter sp.]|nr:DUF2889 domain-containing protein [Dethiobacter sp.]
MSLFNRRIEIDINPHGDGMFRLVTSLSDVYHDIILTLFIAGQEFRIVEAQVEMKRIPHPRCREICRLANALTGLTVSPGFARQVQASLGGEDGCPNMVNLVLLTAPLVINVTVMQRLLQEELSPEQQEAAWQGALGGVCAAYPKKERTCTIA